MDKYKTKMSERCAVGGIHCSCCNPYHPKKNRGKDKKKLNRIARHKLKQEDSLDNNAEI
jgi:hypothetical protein